MDQELLSKTHASQTEPEEDEDQRQVWTKPQVSLNQSYPPPSAPHPESTPLHPLTALGEGHLKSSMWSLYGTTGFNWRDIAHFPVHPVPPIWWFTYIRKFLPYPLLILFMRRARYGNGEWVCGHWRRKSLNWMVFHFKVCLWLNLLHSDCIPPVPPTFIYTLWWLLVIIFRASSSSFLLPLVSVWGGSDHRHSPLSLSLSPLLKRLESP